MIDLVWMISAIAAVAICAALVWRLRRERRKIASLKVVAAELRAHARILTDSNRQGILMCDGRGLIRRANPAAEKMCGYREAELIGQSFLRLVPESPAGRGGEAEVRCKDGSRVRRRLTSARTGGEKSEVYLFFDEVEGKPEAPQPEAKPAQKAETQEVEAVRRTPVEDVVNRIVREFEGLLTTISGYTELALHGTPATSPVRKDLEEVAAASDSASNLARNLLAYSGRQTIPVEAIDLNALVGALESGLREAMKTPFHVALAEERTTVLANGECLGQILMILCTSARHRLNSGLSNGGVHPASQTAGDAANEANRVEVRTEKRRIEEALPVYTGKVPAGVYSVLSVTDSGPALESATLAHLFEPLFLDRESLGVELAPVHGIVRNLGGWIDVTSTEKKGTTFEVLFPYAGDSQVKSRATASLVG